MKRFKRHLRSLLGWLLLKSRLYRFFLRGRAVIVLFHRVGEAYPGDEIGISPEHFRNFCDLFVSSFRPLSLTSLLEKLRAGEDLSGHLVITFDDGYLDNYTVASEILRDRGLPACFFIATGFMDTDRVAGWDADNGVESRWMSWRHVKQLKSLGFEVGAHTVNHVNLGNPATFEREGVANLPVHWGVDMDADAQAAEIRGSKLELERQLDCPVDLFAYPFGRSENLSEENRQLVQELGFSCCTSAFGGLVDRHASPYALNRIPIGQWYTSPSQLIWDLCFGHR